MSSIVNNQAALLSEWWGGGLEGYDWFVFPTNAANIVFGANPVYQISDFLAFYPKFGTGVQAIVALQVSSGILGIAIDPTEAGINYVVGDQLALVQAGASGGMVEVTSIGLDGEITGIELVEGGVGYTVATAVPTTGGSGTGALINIVSLDMLGGSGYQVGDVVTVLQADASGGLAGVTAVDGTGAVTAISVQIPGTGYTPVAGLLTRGGNGSGLQIDVTQISPYNGVVPQVVLQTYITLANACLSQARWLDMWLFAMHLFVAHYATLYLVSEGDAGSTAGQIAQSGLQTGVTIAASSGDVSISVDQIAKDHLSQFGVWLTTVYGQQLAQMASSVGSGMMLIF